MVAIMIEKQKEWPQRQNLPRRIQTASKKTLCETLRLRAFVTEKGLFYTKTSSLLFKRKPRVCAIKHLK